MKKGLLGSNIADFLAYFLFVLVIIIFYVIFSWGGDKVSYKINSEAGYTDTGLLLLNVLRTPYDAKSNVADLLVNSVSQKNFKEFEQMVNPIFTDYFSSNFDDCCWKLTIWQQGKKLDELRSSVCDNTQSEELQHSVKLPLVNPKEPVIDVTLSLFRKGTVGSMEGGYEQVVQCAYKK